MSKPSEPLGHGARRVALVTGASRGIGHAIAKELADRDHDCILVARDAGRLRDLAAELEDAGVSTLVLPADLSNAEDARAVVAEGHRTFGRLDVVVNNAGVLPRATKLKKLSMDDWTTTVALNVTAPLVISQTACPLMINGGVIVNIASTASFYPSAGLAAYNMSKAALAMLTRCAALEWSSSGIRVPGVVPGKVDTAMVAPILDYLAEHDEQVNPQGRVGSPEDVATPVGFLVSDKARYITGTLIAVDGGELIQAGIGA